MILCSITNDLIPICICCVLPITIVWIVMKTARFRESKRTEVLIKAIESGKDLDANMIANAMAKPAKPRKSPREILNIRLTVGSIFTLMGLFIFAIEIAAFRFDERPMVILGIPAVIILAIGLGFLITYFVTRKQIKD